MLNTGRYTKHTYFTLYAIQSTFYHIRPHLHGNILVQVERRLLLDHTAPVSEIHDDVTFSTTSCSDERCYKSLLFNLLWEQISLGIREWIRPAVNYSEIGVFRGTELLPSLLLFFEHVSLLNARITFKEWLWLPRSPITAVFAIDIRSTLNGFKMFFVYKSKHQINDNYWSHCKLSTYWMVYKGTAANSPAIIAELCSDHLKVVRS